MNDAWAEMLEKARAEGRLNEFLDYFERNRKASRGEQAHDYCHGRGCISCGCSADGPCVSHRQLKPPVFPGGWNYPSLGTISERKP